MYKLTIKKIIFKKVVNNQNPSLLNYSILLFSMCLRFYKSIMSVWRENYISVCHLASLPKTKFRDITPVA